MWEAVFSFIFCVGKFGGGILNWVVWSCLVLYAGYFEPRSRVVRLERDLFYIVEEKRREQ